MISSFTAGKRSVLFLLWICAFIAIPFWVRTDPAGWDLEVYRNALNSLHAGHDPYVDGMTVQQEFHRTLAQHPNDTPPYTYVYSPMTLPLLKAVGLLPLALSGAVYWAIYIAGVLLQIGAGLFAAEKNERNFFVFLAPAAAFFPGLLVQDNILSGNIAYILYGLMLGAAVVGWRRQQWTWFYLVALFASCCKAPLLSLLLIPVLTARRQWLPACLTGAAGLVLFAGQPLLWPELFRHYLQAVELQFSYNRDFGFSVAGLFSHDFAGASYALASTVVYALYAMPVLGLLLFLARRYFAGALSLERWIPVMLVGVILLNPRIMIYDVAPVTLPLVIILWRFIAQRLAEVKGAILLAGLFLLANVLVAGIFTHIDVWKHVDGLLIAAVFALGAWDLLKISAPVSSTSLG